MKLDGGKLDRRLELLSAASDHDSLGQKTTSHTLATTVYAQRLELRTQDAARAGGREAFTLARFLIRYRADLDTTMRARVDGRLYDIVSVDEPDRRRSLVLTCEEVTR